MTVTDTQLAMAGEALAEVLVRKGLTVATAESCTGGWVAKVLTDRAGSSAYLMAGLVTYSNDAKRSVLGVPDETLEQHGAVSEPVVRHMVRGAIQVANVDVAVAISGIAGPGGGTEQKPVGTVWFAWGAAAGGAEARVQCFEGDRDQVRRQAVLYVLEGVTGFLEGL
ncbi:nicotinamide-nucleotide amidase [Marinobacter daepoensis]|uniref:Nicotinamide-nucleotide amidase n=1 Tax=Marinobacter daepoensis TaxID=262077 RepID=A0ABS3BDV8_9GAMM|nr:nicotinamide-nucleotide amidase [Marinobacter daepoensis]MBN7769738.1 nicotinamide-nucleotide amidase [Marinobacter daepoensis]MBY6078428.1 nicotinamide-nucleotide amidase [Marinobacter daepoensis]